MTPPVRQRLRFAIALAFALAVPGASPALAAGLLTDRQPSSAGPGTPVGPAYTDGQVLPDGAGWNSPGTLRIPSGGYVQWDLGRVEPIRGAAIQADNNDEYVLSVSEAGLAWLEVWRAPAVGVPGLQTRETMTLDTRARYVRLTPAGGDGYYSVSELEVFANDAQRSRSRVLRPKWLPQHPLDVAWAIALGVAALVLLAVSRRSPRPLVIIAGAVLALGFAVMFKRAVVDPPSVEPARLNFMRAAVAGLALLAVGRSLLFRRRYPAHERLSVLVLAMTAVLGVLCFVNLGRAQFYDQGKHRPTYLHHYDMRTYFPIAKYFPELRFDGVYAASAAAVGDERGGLDGVAEVGFRDLRTHVPTNVKASRDHVEAVRARFSDARWAEFKKDMGYFRAAMGDGGFLGSMGDHGGNATPVWFLGARLLFGLLPASDLALWLGVAADAVLLLLGFAALWWAFGPRTALLGMTVFGAMDFYMFGTNWFGAALRHDWLALWCLGLAALKRERFRLAGALLAWSALIRAFPALTLLTLAVPAVWDALVRLVKRRFSLRAWVKAQRAVFQVALGAMVFGGLLFLASVAMFGGAAWTEWWRKVSLLNADGHLNNLAVKTYVVGAGAGYVAVVIASVLMVVLAVRRAPPVEAAAFGVVLLPVVFNPANYYLHAAFLPVVLGRENRDAPEDTPTSGRLAWMVLLAMCVASYFTTLTADLGKHFRTDTWVLLSAFGLLWLVQVVRSFRRGAPVAAVDAAVGPPVGADSTLPDSTP
ncbi:MAG: discoidin domain-containing protein [Myxococcota bacterium]